MQLLYTTVTCLDGCDCDTVCCTGDIDWQDLAALADQYVTGVCHHGTTVERLDMGVCWQWHTYFWSFINLNKLN